MVRKKWWHEFASTLKEWHYIVSSFFTGGVVGFALAVYLFIRILREVNRAYDKR